MARKRNYKREYAMYHGKPEQIKKRAARVKARRMMEKKGDIPAGMDVDHKVPLRAGGTSAPGNLRLRSVKANRGWRKGKS